MELDQLPFYEVQTLYYLLWKEREEESKLSEEEKGAKALDNMIEDEM